MSLSLASLAPSSSASYASAGRQFLSFWAYFTSSYVLSSFSSLPPEAATDAVLAAFVSWMAVEKKLAPASCRSYLLAVRSLLRLAGRGSSLPIHGGSTADRCLTGVSRIFNADRSRPPRSPLTVSILSRLKAWLANNLSPNTNPCTWPHFSRLLFFAVLTCSFAAGLRISELLPTASNPLRGLRVSDVFGFDEVTGDIHPVVQAMRSRHLGPWVLFIRESKTDSSHAGLAKVVANLADGNICCPALALREFWEASLLSGQRSDSPDPLLFVTTSGSAYSDDSYRAHLTEALRSAGVPDAESYSTHSARIGAASSLVHAGVETSGVERALGWKPTCAPMVHRYSRTDFSDILKAQRAMFSVPSPTVVNLRAVKARPTSVLLSSAPHVSSIPPSNSSSAIGPIRRSSVPQTVPPQHPHSLFCLPSVQSSFSLARATAQRINLASQRSGAIVYSSPDPSRIPQALQSSSEGSSIGPS